jgi:hypothetical protein
VETFLTLPKDDQFCLLAPPMRLELASSAAAALATALFVLMELG